MSARAGVDAGVLAAGAAVAVAGSTVGGANAGVPLAVAFASSAVAVSHLRPEGLSGHGVRGAVRRARALVARLFVFATVWLALARYALAPLVCGAHAPFFASDHRRASGGVAPGWQLAAKYAVGRLLALVALGLLAPLMVAIAVAIRASSPGPVLFRQRRVGLDGREFEILKYRSRAGEPRTGPIRLVTGSAPGGVEGADRRTRIGRWLRASSLDELPQLINVVRGEMALIGPRPERPEFVALFAERYPDYHARHRMKAGITGWAQAKGLRGHASEQLSQAA